MIIKRIKLINLVMHMLVIGAIIFIGKFVFQVVSTPLNSGTVAPILAIPVLLLIGNILVYGVLLNTNSFPILMQHQSNQRDNSNVLTPD